MIVEFAFFIYLQQQLGGLGNKLSALGNQIEAIKQKQASLGKTIKIQGSKHFKDLLQIRRSELLNKRGMLSSKDMKEDISPPMDVEINLNLSQSLCLTVAKGLGLLLLRMDSTCHSDVYLIVCKALAKIATSCRPSIPLGAVFDVDQLATFICGSCGSDYVRERNWSSSWVSHATMCLIQDILEGENCILHHLPKETTGKMVLQQLFLPVEVQVMPWAKILWKASQKSKR